MSRTKLRPDGAITRKPQDKENKQEWVTVPIQIPKALYYLLDKNYEDPLGLLNELLIQSILPLINQSEIAQ